MAKLAYIRILDTNVLRRGDVFEKRLRNVGVITSDNRIVRQNLRHSYRQKASACIPFQQTQPGKRAKVQYARVVLCVDVSLVSLTRSGVAS